MLVLWTYETLCQYHPRFNFFHTMFTSSFWYCHVFIQSKLKCNTQVGVTESTKPQTETVENRPFDYTTNCRINLLQHIKIALSLVSYRTAIPHTNETARTLKQRESPQTITRQVFKNNTSSSNDIRETNYVIVNNIIWYLWQVDYPWELDWYTLVDHDVKDQWEYMS